MDAPASGAQLCATAMTGRAPLPFMVMAAVLVAALLSLPFAGGSAIPHWVRWSSSLSSHDLDADGEMETLLLSRGKLEIADGRGEMRSTSPRAWRVSQVLAGDIDHDGTPEVLLVAWRRGSYGEARPFWVRLDSTGFSQHIFVFDYEAGRLEPLWMSSALGYEARDVALDSNGRLHIATPPENEGEAELVFAWEDWGFTLLDEAPM